MKKILAIVLMFVCVFASAMETNLFFVTDDGFLITQSKTNNFWINPEKVKLAKTRRDSLPAELFTEGNWGTIQNGFQLSLRFDKTNFVLGETIKADLLIRNVTNTILTYNASFSSIYGGPVSFTVTGEHGLYLKQRLEPITIYNSHERHLYPGTQHEYVENLNGASELTTNGVYSVYAHLKISCPDCVEVESARVKIAIYGPSKNK